MRSSYAAKVAETLGSANVRFNLAPFALKSLGDIVSSLEEPLSDSAVAAALAPLQRDQRLRQGRALGRGR